MENDYKLLDNELLDYMLDYDIVIGAEYEFFNELDYEHCESLIEQALNVARKNNDLDIAKKFEIELNKIKKFIKM